MNQSSFTDAEDLRLLRERACGTSWNDLARAMRRGKVTLQRRYDELTGVSTVRPPARPRQGIRTPIGEPIAALPEPVDDAAHVVRLLRGGGFRPLSIYAERYA